MGTVAGGGGTSTGGGYSITDTIGQASTGQMTGGGFVLSGGFGAPVPNAGGVTNEIAVTNLLSSGSGSLASAVTNAPAGSVITFDTSLSGTISLASALVINKDLTILGPPFGGTNTITLSGTGVDRVLNLIGGIVQICNVGIANGVTSTNGAGAFNCTYATFCNCTFTNHSAGGRGGAFYNCADGNVTFNNCTFAGNSAQAGGGALDNAGVAVLNDCTVASNSAPTAAGGGLRVEGGASLTLNSCTISGNTASSGGGIYDASGQLTVQSTIVAGNSIGQGGHGPDIWNTAGPSVSWGYNLIGLDDDSSGWSQGVSDQFGHGTTPILPLLARLQDYGGPTPTMALLPGSPAIDRGSGSGLGIDQRGFGRGVQVLPLLFPPGDWSDIGAFEVQPGLDVTEPPVLLIEQSGVDVFVLWEAIAKAYTLESNDNLGAPDGWRPVVATFDTVYDDSNTAYARYRTPGGHVEFYRLRAP